MVWTLDKSLDMDTLVIPTLNYIHSTAVSGDGKVSAFCGTIRTPTAQTQNCLYFYYDNTTKTIICELPTGLVAPASSLLC